MSLNKETKENEKKTEHKVDIFHYNEILLG